MRDADVELNPWPAAFSESFVEGARRLFDERNNVMIVGSLGSKRGTLAARLSGPSAPVAWGRDSLSVETTALRYSTINQLLPTVQAHPDDSSSQVVEKVRAAIGRTFGRPTVCVREAELCDQGSNDVLAALVEDGHIRLVSTVAPSAALTHRFARSAERIDIPPLDESVVSQLLAIRFSATPHPTTVSLLLQRSQGAYAVLQQFADAAFAAGQIQVLADTLVIDTSVLNADVDDLFVAMGHNTMSRFSGNRFARDLLDVTAVADSLDRAEAVDVFGDQVVNEVIDAGALEVVGQVLQFRSAVDGLSIVRNLDLARRRELFDTYRGRLERSERLPTTALRSARWHVDVAVPLPPDLALRAVRHANPACRYGIVLALVEAVPAADRPLALVIEHCHALAETGADDELVDQVRSIDPATLGDDALFAYLRWARRLLPPGEVDAILAILGSSVSESASRRAALELCRTYGEVFQSGDQQIRKDLLALTMSGQLSPANQALARMTMSASLRHVSRVDQAIEMATTAIRELEALDGVASFYVEMAREHQIMAHLSGADLDGAREALVQYSAPGVAHGNLGRSGPALWSLLAFYTGDVGASLAQIQMCLTLIPASDPHQSRAMAEAMAAQILTQVGDIDGVYELLAASHRRPSHPRRELQLQLMIAQACVHDAIGEPEESLDLLQAVVAEAREHGLLLCEVDAAVLSVQIDGPRHIKSLLQAVETIDESGGTSAIWKTFAHAVRDNDMHRLVELAEDLDRQRRRLFAAEVAQFTLDIARRAADMTPEQRVRLGQIADPMQHRKVTRAP